MWKNVEDSKNLGKNLKENEKNCMQHRMSQNLMNFFSHEKKPTGITVRMWMGFTKFRGLIRR